MKALNSLSKFFLCIALGLSCGVFAQKKPTNNLNIGSIYEIKCRSSYENIKLGNDDPEAVKNLLIKKIKELQNPQSSLKLSYNKTSPVGNHYTYQQYYNNIPVYNASIKASLDNEKNIYVIINETVDLSFLNPSTIKSQVANLSKTDFVKKFVSTRYKSPVDYKQEINICVTKNNEAFAVQKIEMSAKDDNGGFDILSLINEKGTVIYQKDQRRYYRSFAPAFVGDSITVSIFNPNPITFAHAVAGGNYVDNNDADNATLTADRVNKKVVATLTNGTYSLVNKYVKMVDLTTPANTPPTQTSPVFDFTRSQKQFEEINAFYHVTKMQEYIQSIGFTNICNYQTPLDSHGGTADNSYFTPGANSINIGEGCVDDGEDADVFVHEYGHACSHSANNNSTGSGDRGALDEAFGDYQAVSYRRAIDDFDWGKVFPWDGIAACWGGRRADATKVYPGGLVGEIHTDGEIWCSAMMSIWTILGRTITDKLQYTSLYNWTNNMKMTDAAQLVINADKQLNAGANFFVLCTQFKKFGLYSGTCSTGIDPDPFTYNGVEIQNSASFAMGNGNLTIVLPATEQKINLEAFDVTGRKVFQSEKENTNTITLSPNDLEKGFYVLSIKAGNRNYSAKIVRVN